MRSIWVEPVLSRITAPKCAVKRSPILHGSASAADVQMRSATSTLAGRLDKASMLA